MARRTQCVVWRREQITAATPPRWRARFFCTTPPLGATSTTTSAPGPAHPPRRIRVRARPLHALRSASEACRADTDCIVHVDQMFGRLSALIDLHQRRRRLTRALPVAALEANGQANNTLVVRARASTRD